MKQNSVRIILPVVVGLVFLLLLAGCTNGNETRHREGKVTIVTSFFPLYDFARQIGGEHVHVVNLIPTGVDSHDWTPKTSDLRLMHDAHVFIYNGFGFEGWVDRLLADLPDDTVIVEASSGIEPIAAADADGHGDHEHEAEEAHDHEHGDVDPHVWLSPLQAMRIAENIKEGLVSADEAHRDDYERNYEALRSELEQLHRLFEQTAADAARKDIVVSHQAYAYLVRDYGLRQIPIMGITPDSEPTAQDLKQILDYIKANDVKYILFEELASPKLAETLAGDAGVETLVFNLLEGLTKEQEQAGENYVTLMKQNAEVLKKALQ